MRLPIALAATLLAMPLGVAEAFTPTGPNDCAPLGPTPAAACTPLEFPVACRPAWAIGLDWVLLGRERPDSATELVGCNCVDPDLRFAANQFDPDRGTGARLRAYRRDPTGVDYEFSYLDVDDFSDARAFSGDLRVLGTDLGTSSTAGAIFSSELRGVELNALVDGDAWTRYYAGLRWMQLREHAAVSGSGGLATVAASSEVENQLLGAQVGVRWLIFDQGGPWTADVALETGLFANLIDRDTVGFGTTTLETTELASLSEVELGVGYAFSGCWSFNLGAHFLWLGNVASAPEQFGSPLAIADSSTIFYAGGSLGLTRVW